MNFNEKIDYSSLSTYVDCPRKFFFQYIMNLRSEGQSLDLVFGACWHYGMEKAFIELKSNSKVDKSSLIQIAKEAFIKLWSIEGSSFNEEISFPKNPGNAFSMYDSFFKGHLPTGMKIIAIEQPFAIMLAPDLPFYTGRIDMIIEHEDQLKVIDHKTAKYINETTMTGYECSFQTDGYLSAAYIYYDKIPSMEYWIAQVAKTKNTFTRFTVRKPAHSIERSVNDISFYIRNILADIRLYETEKHETDKGYIQLSFRRSCGYACTQYFRKCSYYDICHARNNAMTFTDKIPSGYIINEWDPDKHNEEMREKLND